MAGKAAEYHRGDMDIHEQQATWRLVMGLSKWGSLTIAALLVFLVLWFAADVGFLSAFFTAAVVVVLGIVFLRSAPAEGH